MKYVSEKYAADFRREARSALKGRWAIAVVAGLIVVMLGSLSVGGPELEIELDAGVLSVSLTLGNMALYSTDKGFAPELMEILIGGLSPLLGAALVFGVAYYILGSIITLGYKKFNLDLVDRQKEPDLASLFGYFRHWKTAAAAKFLQDLYVFLWSLLLIIPGIMAGYSYAMTEYILAEHPEMTAGEAIARSREMMDGYRGRLFCLDLSFIGWALLSALTFNIGDLWLNPYRQAARAAFYREISGTSPAQPEENLWQGE